MDLKLINNSDKNEFLLMFFPIENVGFTIGFTIQYKQLYNLYIQLRDIFKDG